MILAEDEPGSSFPPAHKRSIHGLDAPSREPASQVGSLIWKQGGTIKSIQASNLLSSCSRSY